MLRLQALLSLFLLAVPSIAANGLRSTQTQQAKVRRNLQEDLESDEIAFTIQYNITVAEGSLEEIAGPALVAGFATKAYEWLKETIKTVDRANTTWSIERDYNDISYYGLVSSVPGEMFPNPEPRRHIVTITYIASFGELEAPAGVAWMDSIEAEADEADLITNLQSLTDNLFQNAESITTTWTQIASGPRDGFEFSYVLPFRMSWNFNTTLDLAPPIEFQAAVNASREWISDNWDSFYGTDQAIGLQNVDIRVRFTTFQPTTTDRYQQRLAMYVQLVIGSNDIENVPEVTDYLEWMQLYYSVPQFVTSLRAFQDQYMPADQVRVLPGSQQSLSVTPTYEVVTVSESQSRLDPDFDEIASPTVAIVTVDLGGIVNGGK